MKNNKLYSILFAIITVCLISCEKSDDTDSGSQALELPPFETMAYDFDSFTTNQAAGKSFTAAKAPNGNWVFSRLVVGFWNTALFSTLAVPVASFEAAFDHEPEAIGDLKWEWTYSVDGFTSEYTARLTGEIQEEQVVWEMYVTKSGIDPFDEFLWFTGSSNLNGTMGHWVLNESPERPIPMLRIDWERNSEELGSIRYTWVRELDENENDDLFRDSYLEYGLQEGDYDAYFDARAYDENLQGFSEIRIEWNRNDYFGRVMAPQYFEDEIWHCWDGSGEDVLCE